MWPFGSRWLVAKTQSCTANDPVPVQSKIHVTKSGGGISHGWDWLFDIKFGTIATGENEMHRQEQFSIGCHRPCEIRIVNGVAGLTE